MRIYWISAPRSFRTNTLWWQAWSQVLFSIVELPNSRFWKCLRGNSTQITRAFLLIRTHYFLGLILKYPQTTQTHFYASQKAIFQLYFLSSNLPILASPPTPSIVLWFSPFPLVFTTFNQSSSETFSFADIHPIWGRIKAVPYLKQDIWLASKTVLKELITKVLEMHLLYLTQQPILEGLLQCKLHLKDWEVLYKLEPRIDYT